MTARPNLPSVRVEFLAHALYRNDFKALEEIVKQVSGHFLSTTTKTQVSRADVAVDFHPLAGTWKPPDMSSIVSLAKARVVHYEGSEVTSITIGKSKGGLQVQLYNKRSEMHHSGKDWMESVWRESSKNYDPRAPVWRMELRVYRRLMRVLEDAEGYGIESIKDLEQSLGNIVSFAFESRSIGDKEIKGWLRIVELQVTRTQVGDWRLIGSRCLSRRWERTWKGLNVPSPLLANLRFL